MPLPDCFNFFGNLFESDDIYTAIRPIYMAMLLHGLTPFWMSKDAGGQIHLWTTVFGFLNQAFHILLYGGIYIYSLQYHESIDNYFYRTGISRIVNNVRSLCSFVGSITIYCMAVVQCRQLPQILRILNGLDGNFLQLHVQVKYNGIRRFTIIVICLESVIIGSYFIGVYEILRSMGITPSPIVCVQFYLQHATLFLSIYMYCCISKGIERRLELLQKVSKIHLNLYLNIEKPSRPPTPNEYLDFTSECPCSFWSKDPKIQRLRINDLSHNLSLLMG